MWHNLSSQLPGKQRQEDHEFQASLAICKILAIFCFFLVLGIKLSALHMLGCLSYCSIAVIKLHDQDHLPKKAFNWAYSSGGLGLVPGGEAQWQEQLRAHILFCK